MQEADTSTTQNAVADSSTAQADSSKSGMNIVSDSAEDAIQELAANNGLLQLIHDWGVWGVIAAVSIFIITALVIHFVVFRGILKWVSKESEKETLPFFLNKYLKNPVRWLFVIIAFWASFGFIKLEASKTFMNYMSHFTYIALVVTIVVIIVRSLTVAREVMANHYDYTDDNNLHARKVQTQFKLIERVVTFMVIVIGIAVALMTFKTVRELGATLLASAGVLGIVIGFAAQKSIATVFAGIQIALAQPIRMDDVVIVEGEWGRIEEITLTYVVVRIWDERRLVLPITHFIDKPFQNWTRTSAQLLGTVFIYADYTAPVDALRKELTRLLESNKLWDKRVDVLQVTNANDKTVEIRALMSASNSGDAFDLRCFVRENLIIFLQKNHPESLPRTRIEMEEDGPAHKKSIARQSSMAHNKVSEQMMQKRDIPEEGIPEDFID